jgi:hypothetical protein
MMNNMSGLATGILLEAMQTHQGKSGGAPPHSKTQARKLNSERRPRFGVRQHSGAFSFLGATPHKHE